MNIKKNFVLQLIDDIGYLAVPVGHEHETFHGIVTLNEPVFSLLHAMQDHSLSREDMISFLTDHYLVDSETAAADLDVLIHDLLEMELIEA